MKSDIEKNDLKIEDILDTEYLQRIQNSFAAVTGITTVVVNKDGLPITVPSNLHGFCALMQAKDETRTKCISTNMSLIQENNKTKKPAVVVCPHSGLVTASIPVLINNKPVAYWIIGQLKMEKYPKEVLIENAKVINESVETLTKLMELLPKYSKEQFYLIFEHFSTISDTLVKIAQASYDAQEKNTELIKTTKALESTQEVVTAFADSTNVAMFVYDCTEEKMLISNKAFCDLASVSKEEMVNLSFYELGGKYAQFNVFFENLKCDCDAIAKIRFTEDNHHFEFGGRWWRRNVKPIKWINDNCTVMVTFYDITKEVLTQNQLEDLAYYDRSMHLPNLLKLAEDYKLEENKDSYLIFIDITKLRRINDSYGRNIGDTLLNLIVDWLYSLLSEHDTIYRTDGDEFCILLKRAKIEKARDFAQTISDRFEKEWLLSVNGEDVYVFSSVTIAILDSNVVTDDSTSLSTLIERSMDTTKKEKRIALYDEQMDIEFKNYLKFELNLKNSVNQSMKGFYLNFQPIVSVETGKWSGLETLCRWRSDEFGHVPPSMFIYEAEKLGLMENLGYWVLEEAIKHCKKLKLDEIEDFILDVNVSPVQIANGNFDQKIFNILEKYDFPKRCLSMEITESMELVFNERMRVALENLRECNVSVALDDFGIGYASFQSLKNVPANTIKTEREFVRDIETDPYLRQLFKTMVNLAHIADKKLIAEGVETKEQLAIVIESGADYIQGYYFEKPLSYEELEENLQKFHEVQLCFHSEI